MRQVSRRTRRVVSLLGDLSLVRPYYHCGACSQGRFPFDEEVGLAAAQLTPAASEVVALVGVQTSFAQASEITLRKVAGLWLSESTVERVTESAGERLVALQEQRVTLGELRPWEWERDACGFSCAYVSLDATGIRQQGPGGAQADGRMAYVAMVYNPRGASETRERKKPSHSHEVRYLAGLYEPLELGLQLRKAAWEVGWDEAERQIALSDGGAGLEDFMRSNFPLAVHILDFYHAQEHLVALSSALFPEEDETSTQQRCEWLDQSCHQLKHEGGLSVLQSLEKYDVSGRAEWVREAHRRETNYFRNHQHKMDYPKYLAHGWQIGSGPVEAACKTVVNNRLCGSGMRWGEEGSNALCHLRALFLSERRLWDSFWHEHPN